MIKNLLKTIGFGLLCLVLLNLFAFSQAYAQACEDIVCEQKDDDQTAYIGCIQKKQVCLENKIDETREQKNTLQNAISILNGQIQVQQLHISQTQTEINQLENEIADLSTRIEGLEISLDRMTDLLIERINANYKRTTTNPVMLLLAADSFGEFIADYKYVQIAQKHISEVMLEAEEQRLAYDNQKEIKEIKQAQVEEKRAQLRAQKYQLDQQQSEQKRLLTVTENDERRYQQLLAEAKAEIASFKSFSSSKGGGVLDPQNSPDGWYFSQRDSRWAGATIGSSGESIMDVGCLVASTAMVKKKFGEDVNPVTIAANSSYFFANTAYMLKPWPAPSGKHWVDTPYTQSRLDSHLEKNPVILKLSAGPYGTHFIVVKDKKDGKYIIHDPWEGYDKNLTDYYTLGQIIRISYLAQ